MALINQAKGRGNKQSTSGYVRVFRISELVNLISKIQAAVISAGTELEKLILERASKIKDLDAFLDGNIHKQEHSGIFMASKNQVKKPNSINSRVEPDFLAFDLIKRLCYVVQVKDGGKGVRLIHRNLRLN